MYRYILKRIFMMIPVIAGVSFLVFFIMDLAPGDAVDSLAPEGATQEELMELREEMGLNDPIVVRYVRYMGGMLRGDLGVSYVTHRDVLDTYLLALPKTVKLAFASVLLAVAVSIPLGVYAATHHGSIQDNLSAGFAILGLSMPNFWLGLLLIIVFSLKLHWLPSVGDEQAASIILPSVTIATGLMATLTRTTRSTMLDILGQDYLRTARAKGLKENRVIRVHAVKNAMIPIMTIIGTQLAGVLGGSVLTESVFSWPGVGRLIVDSLNMRDTPLVTGSIIMTTILLSIVLLAVDLLYAAVDPRIRVQYKGS
ncbi:ABC transporter permease [Lachnospiraceae bacterium 54-53]